jgi:hypothetical protein
MDGTIFSGLVELLDYDSLSTKILFSELGGDIFDSNAISTWSEFAWMDFDDPNSLSYPTPSENVSISRPRADNVLSAPSVPASMTANPEFSNTVAEMSPLSLFLIGQSST